MNETKKMGLPGPKSQGVKLTEQEIHDAIVSGCKKSSVMLENIIKDDERIEKITSNSIYK